jgi:hypothetical protein
VFGSVASGLADDRSDVDLLVICRSRLIPLAARKRVLSTIGERWSFHQGPDVHDLFADQDVDGLVEEIPVTIAYQTVAWIEDVLADVVDHGAITTSKVSFRPYTMPALLLRSWVLRDPDGVVASWRDRARTYPHALRANVLQQLIPRLRDETADLVDAAERGLGPGIFLVHLTRATDALRGILLALNEVFDPADKRADQAVLPTLQRAPRNFLPILTEVLTGPFDSVGMVERAGQFHQLAEEALNLAVLEVPPTPMA